MRPGESRNLVPENPARSLPRTNGWVIDGEILDTLSVEMNFTALVARKAFEKFGERTLRAMAAVDERRNDREPQVSLSTDSG